MTIVNAKEILFIRICACSYCCEEQYYASHDACASNRVLLLKKKVTIQRETITDRSIRNQINEISGKIGKIGVNYNQVVKLLQSLSNTTKKDGRPVINTKIVASQMDQIAKLTKEIKKQQERLIEQVAMVNPEIIPHNDQDIIM